MTRTFMEEAILVDTSAAIALADRNDQFHEAAECFYGSTTGVVWASLNATAHETYTRARFALGFREALRLYDFLTGRPLMCMPFIGEDEGVARDHLVRFHEHKLSFHDALFAAVMKRIGIYRAFTFDRHFFLFGFEVLPGPVR
jgi:predicted nucleic acid-binding protein